MNLIQVISTFLGSPSAWRVVSKNSLTVTAAVGGGVWNLQLSSPERRRESLFFAQVQAGFSVPLSTDALPADEIQRWLGRNGQIFRRPLLGRELTYNDFIGPARALSVGPFTMICFGTAATIVSVALTLAPPASIAAQIWGSVAIAFITPSAATNPRVSAEAVFALGLCSRTVVPDIRDHPFWG